MKDTRREGRIKRHRRVRQKVSGSSSSPRLAVFRSLNHIYCQVIDDTKGHTLAAASTLDAEIKGDLAGKNKSACSGLVGTLIAKRALGQGIKQVAFDRGGNRFHGRVKTLADAARKEGLKF